MGETLTLRTTAGSLWRLVRSPIAECETETRNGRPNRIELAPDELDRGFALNGLNEYFYYNVLGGDRLLECARSAVSNPSLPPIDWETGRMAPAPPTRETTRRLDPER